MGHQTYPGRTAKTRSAGQSGYMRQARRETPPCHTGQTWATFLANHTPQIWACDFLQSYDVLFRTLFLFFIIEHGSRRVVHFAVTRAPTDAWVAQQIREATGFGVGPRSTECCLNALSLVFTSNCCTHLSKPRKPIRCVSVSSVVFGANAWTIC